MKDVSSFYLDNAVTLFPDTQQERSGGDMGNAEWALERAGVLWVIILTLHHSHPFTGQIVIGLSQNGSYKLFLFPIS